MDRTDQGLDFEEQTRVLDATFALLGQGGLSADFIDKVAAQVGIDSRRIFLHYGGANRLLQALMERELEVIAGSVPAPELRFPGETVQDELEVMARILIDECRAHVGFLRALLIEAVRNEDFAQVFYRTFILRGRTLFTEFLNIRKTRGELRDDIDIEAAAAFFLSALIFSLLVLEVFGGKAVEKVDDSRMIRGMSDLFLKGALARR